MVCVRDTMCRARPHTHFWCIQSQGNVSGGCKYRPIFLLNKIFKKLKQLSLLLSVL